MFANNMFFQKLAVSLEKWLDCNSVFYWFKAFLCEFEKINVFLVNTVLGQVSVIANNMFFLKN